MGQRRAGQVHPSHLNASHGEFGFDRGVDERCSADWWRERAYHHNTRAAHEIEPLVMSFHSLVRSIIAPRGNARQVVKAGDLSGIVVNSQLISSPMPPTTRILAPYYADTLENRTSVARPPKALHRPARKDFQALENPMLGLPSLPSTFAHAQRHVAPRRLLPGWPVMPARSARRRILEAVRKARKFAKLIQQPEWRRGMRSGVAATVEHDALPLRPDLRTVIDVGANRGQFTLYACTRFPTAEVVAFEPLPVARGQMLRLFDKEDRVTVAPFALGEANGEMDIHLSARDDSSSLLPIGGRQTSIFPGTEEVGTIRASIRTLDDALADREIARPALLKIDVQGFELPVLRGAEKTLQHLDQILIEASFVELYEGQSLFPEVSRYLEDRGFHIVAGHISTFDSSGRWLQGDFVYERE
ncbi:FkbM family methyltransferase [Mycobacterium sp. SMC-16]|uniref:FkbM family methyltransferase n=1 Tax=Mycobacteriaceae TaxID=1762 RepID=UPI0013A56758|nr:FkbM family methyltransferase [Mycolicibacterium mucogenicum]